MEGGDGAVGDVGCYHYEGQEVGLWVGEALEDLVEFDGFVFDAGLVCAQALDGPEFFFAREEFAAHGAVGEDEEDDDSEADGHEANDKKEDLPAGKGGAAVVLKAEAQEGAEDGADAYADVPETDAPGLFGFLLGVSGEFGNWRGGWFLLCTTWW